MHFSAIVLPLSLCSIVLAAPVQEGSGLAQKPSLIQRMDNSIEIDDADPSITYSGAWTHAANQDQLGVPALHNTESYSNDPAATYSIQNKDYSQILIYGGKKNDRGVFDVYVDNVLLGSGDAYSATCTERCHTEVTFRGDLYDPTVPVNPQGVITVKNRATDERLGTAVPNLDVDAIHFYPGYPH